MLQDKTLARVTQLYQPWLVDIRRWLHQNPELSDQEHGTQKFISGQLATLGIEHYTLARTGVVGIVNGRQGGKTVALRADIDALPLEDEKDVPYRSQNPGICHACGHDAHTAIALGVARYFQERKEQFSGAVKLLFQPAEESVGGARRMVEEGCMENPHVDYVIGKHVMPHIEAGAVEIKYGKLNAATDGIKITVLGRSSHGAYPDTGIDALLAAAAVVQGVHTIVSRNISPLEQAVISLGTIEGGHKANILCDKVAINGTMRTTSEGIRQTVKKRLQTVVSAAASAYGATGEVAIRPGYDALVNDNFVVAMIERAAEEFLGRDKIFIKEHPSLGAEDFSFFLHKAKGAFYHLGCGNTAAGITAPLHSNSFDIDESCLAVGVFLDICIIDALLAQMTTKEADLSETLPQC